MSPEWTALRLSVVVAWWASVGVMPLALAAAAALRSNRLPLRPVWEALVNLPLVMPPVVAGYLLLLLLAPRGPLGFLGLALTWKAAALAAGVVAFPLAVQTLRLAFDEVDPRLLQAARTLGASPGRVFWTILVPLSGRGVAGAWALAFARSLGEFGATIIVAGNIPGRTQTLPLALFSASEAGNDPLALRLMALSAGLAFVSLLALGRLSRAAAARRG